MGRITKGEGGPVKDFCADITIQCADCGVPFHFIGCEAGVDFDRPTVNMNSTELRAPIVEGAGALHQKATFKLPQR